MSTKIIPLGDYDAPAPRASSHPTSLPLHTPSTASSSTNSKAAPPLFASSSSENPKSAETTSPQKGYNGRAAAPIAPYLTLSSDPNVPTITAASQKAYNDWAKLLDHDDKLFLTDLDLITVFFSVGVAIHVSESRKVVDEFAANRTRDPSSPPSYPKLVALFNKYEISFETAADYVNHWHEHKSIPRPDEFKPIKSKSVYWITRYISFLVPLLPLFTTKYHIPNYTAYKQAIFKLSLFLSIVLSIVPTFVGHRCRHVGGRSTNNGGTIGDSGAVQFVIL